MTTRINKNSVFFAVIVLTANSCAIDDGIPNFERMSDAELATYNEGRNLGQMIICVEDKTTMSRIRRKRCATVEALSGSAAQAQQLGVLNTAGGLNGN
jgi:hypothetical protein